MSGVAVDVEGMNRTRILTFFAMWFGQMVSLLGAVLTEFALGVWIFQRTGSATQFALFNVFVFVPQILVMPFGGVLADRHSRRIIMMLANAGGALTTLVLLVLFTTHTLEVWSAYAVALSFAGLSSLLMPSYVTAIPQLVPERQLSRANGLVQFATSLARTVSPALGGVLVVTAGLGVIAYINLVTFLFAIATLLPLQIPQPESAPAARRGIFREVADGLRYIIVRPGLLGLLLFVASFNVAGGFSQALTTPLVLRSATPRDLGLVAAAGGIGLIVGSLSLSVWGGPRRRIHGVLGGGIVMGLVMLLPAVRGTVPVYAVWTFVQNVCLSVGIVSSLAIWQSKVPPQIQGRVIGSLRTISYTALVTSVVIAGPLADGIFEPAMSRSGALAGSVGQIIGVGPGRGIALLMVLAGVFPLVGAIAAYLSPKVRLVEDAPEEPPTDTKAAG
jgi:predicted MFS family arabinose efflux permease